MKRLITIIMVVGISNVLFSMDMYEPFEQCLAQERAKDCCFWSYLRGQDRSTQDRIRALDELGLTIVTRSVLDGTIYNGDMSTFESLSDKNKGLMILQRNVNDLLVGHNVRAYDFDRLFKISVLQPSYRSMVGELAGEGLLVQLEQAYESYVAALDRLDFNQIIAQKRFAFKHCAAKVLLFADMSHKREVERYESEKAMMKKAFYDRCVARRNSR